MVVILMEFCLLDNPPHGDSINSNNSQSMRAIC